MRDWIAEVNPEAILFDGFNKALMGIDDRTGVAIYDRDKIIELLCEDMSEEEAWEYYDYNIACLYTGEYTPIILRRPQDC